MFNINPIMHKSVIDILEKGTSNIFTMTAKLHSAENRSVEIVIPIVEQFQIIQSFVSNYTDIVTLSAMLEPEQVLTAVKYYKDLMCSIELVHVPRDISTPIEGMDPITFEYKAVLNKPYDLLKQYNVNELVNASKEVAETREHHLSTRIPLELELFTQQAYDLRHKQINFMVKDTTIKDVILYIANQFGISEIDMIDPDNTVKYENITIPPMHDISTIFHFLQKRYGIYSKSMTYYINYDGTLCMYPPAEMEPKTDKAVHVYNALTGYYKGCHSYHSEEGEQIKIVTISEVQNVDQGELSVENHGTATVALRSDNYLDNNRTLDKGNDGKFRDDNLVKVGLVSDNKAHTDMANVKYTTSSNNAFDLASTLSKENYSAIAFNWEMAVPHKIAPGTKLIYHYESEEGIEVENGVIDHVSYNIIPISKHSVYKYACEASIAGRLKQQAKGEAEE